MWRATMKGLAATKTRLLLTTLSIVLGVGFMAGTFVLTDTMNATFDDLFHDVLGSTDVIVRSAPGFDDRSASESLQREPMPDSIVETVESVDGVSTAMIEVDGYAQIVDPDTGDPIGGGALSSQGTSWDGSTSSLVSLRSGAAPHGVHEVAIDAATARRYDIAAGDEVEILFQGPKRTFTVSGIVGVGDADTLAGISLAIFDVPTAQEVMGKQGLADSVIIDASDGVSAATLRDRIAAALPGGIEAITGGDLADERTDAITDSLGVVRTALLVFAIVALFVGGFIILNTFTIIVTQRARELALLRALGASRRQVLTSVLAEAVIVGLVAGALGVLAGVGIAAGLRALMEAFGIDLPSRSLRVLPRTIWLSLTVGVVITAVASILPARRAAAVAPVEALRDGSDSGARSMGRRVIGGIIVAMAGAALLASGLGSDASPTVVGAGGLVTFVGLAILSPAIVRPAARLIGWPLRRSVSERLGRENAIRNPRRTASTSAALMVGLGLVAFVAVFGASLRASTDRILDETLKADLLVTTDTEDGFSPRAAEALAKVPGVDAMSELRMAEVRIDGEPATVSGVDPAAIGEVATLGITHGTAARLAGGGVLVHEDVATEHDWSVGDAVPVEFARTGERSMTVAGIFEYEELLGGLVIALDEFERNVTQQLDIAVMATVDDRTPVAGAKRASERALAEFPNLEVSDQAEFREDQAAQIDTVMALVTVLLVLAVVISLFGIVNTLALSIHERRREIGLLRAVGMSRRQVRRMVLAESTIVATLGALLGTAVGLFFGWAVQAGLASSGMTELAIPAGQLAQYVLLAALAGLVAGLFPAIRASRLNVLESIGYE